jgi:hypothetical protein
MGISPVSFSYGCRPASVHSGSAALSVVRAFRRAWPLNVAEGIALRARPAPGPSVRPEFKPLFEAWAEIDYAKVRARIARVIRTLTAPPF